MFLILLFITTARSELLVLHQQSLSSYSQAVCNDGSPAIYYIPGVHRGNNIIIYLEVSDVWYTLTQLTWNGSIHCQVTAQLKLR